MFFYGILLFLYINISKIKKTDILSKIILEFVKKSSKIFTSDKCMPIIPTSGSIKLTSLTVVTY